jgi:hypothetical protein
MDTDSHIELGWLWLSVFCSVRGESVLEYITEVSASEMIPWQMDGCQRQFRQTNEHQRYLDKKLNSELHWEVELIQTS